MKKIPCLIIQDHKNKTIPPIEEMQINPLCQWVMEGEGVPTRKWDGTACAIINGQIYVRFDAKLNKKGKRKATPEGSIACEEAPDPVTGHWPHWRPAREPEDKYILGAFENTVPKAIIEWTNFKTFEAIGPKINGNHEKLDFHNIVVHEQSIVNNNRLITQAPETKRSLCSIKNFLTTVPIEGIVFHHEDGRMAKIRRVDFGLSWPVG